MIITTSISLNYVGFDKKRTVIQCIIIGWVLIKNEQLYSALLLGGVYPRNLRSVVLMNVVNQ